MVSGWAERFKAGWNISSSGWLGMYKNIRIMQRDVFISVKICTYIQIHTHMSINSMSVYASIFLFLCVYFAHTHPKP